MLKWFEQKFNYIPVIVAFISIAAVFGVIARADNDIVVIGQLWEQGLPFWQDSIEIEPGQEYKIMLFGGNYSTEGQAVSSVSLVDALPEFSSYKPGETFEILDNSGNWQALSDDGTSPFDGSGISVTADGALSALEFANYKYTVTVDNFLPTGTGELSWQGPVFSFTDAAGVQTKGNMQNTSIAVVSLPLIDSFAVSGTIFKLGDTISITALGTPGKTAYVKIGSIQINLSSSGSDYSGTYTVQAGDDTTDTPRVFFETTTGKGSYRDVVAEITIDTVAPPTPTSLTQSIDQTTLIATLSWTRSSPETDVSQYNIYSNAGSGAVDYINAVGTIAKDGTTNQFTTPALDANKLYTFGIRAQDTAGNIEENTSTVNVPTDFTPPDPPAALVQPTSLNDTIFKFDSNNSLAFSWSSSPSADAASYRLEIDDNSDFSSVITSQETTNTSLALTSTELTLSDGVYYWRVFAIDDAANVSTTAQTASTAATPDNIFEIDTTNPTLAIDSPSTAQFVGADFTISGRASDPNTHISSGTGVNKVEVIIFSLGTGPSGETEYWNGSSWVTTETFNTATITGVDSVASTTWEYAFDSGTQGIVDGRSYQLGARITDESDIQVLEPSSSFITLTGDTSNPGVIIGALSSNFIGANTTISGTATDTGSASLSDVSVSVQRSTDSLYWDASSSQWVSAQTLNTASTSNNFETWGFTILPDTSLADGTTYTINAQATDDAFGTGNISDVASTTLTQDTTAPIVLITNPIIGDSPYNASAWDAANPIQGTATDAGSGLASVEVAIADSSGNYWNGTDWTSLSVVWLSAVSTSGTFATWKYINTSSDFIPNKDDTFTIYARGTDSALGTANTSAQGSGTSIVYDTTAPVISNIVLTNSSISSTTLFKNGDSIVLSATITDLTQFSMSAASITANLSSITGNGGDATVAANTYNTATGDATWTVVAASGTGDGLISVAISATDSAANVGSQSGSITADNTNPAIQTTTLTAPSANAIAWAGASSQTITWASTDITDSNLATNPITLEYSTDGSNWTQIATGEANDGQFAWISIPTIDSQTVQVRIRADDLAENSSNDVSDNQFTIDSTPPTVPSTTLTAPNGAEAWKQGTSQNITWNNAAITDNFGLATNPITLEYTTSTVWNLISSNEANDGSFSWTIPSIDSNTVIVRIRAQDAAGNSAQDSSDANFAIGLPPTITQVNAISDTAIQVVWDKSLFGAGAFANYMATGITATAAAVNGGDNTIVDLTINSLGNTGFTATDFAVAANTVQDTDNFFNEVQSSMQILDKQTPVTSISTSMPNTNQLIANTQPQLRISVSEAPGGSTLFKLDTVTQATGYDASTKTITFTPSSAFSQGTHTISLDLVDIAGNTEANQTWNFWVDAFGSTIAVQTVDFKYSGNQTDETAVSEQQQVSITTFGAAYKIYAQISSALSDGFSNTITDLDMKQAAQAWGSKVDLNGANLVQLVSVSAPGTPSTEALTTNYTFDLRGTIPSLQAAGQYAGSLSFVIVPEY
jgi:hypothetical protein